MGVIKGYAGSVKVGATPTTVGEVKSFTINQSADVQETSSLGNQWATNTTTLKRWTASFEANFDISDTGQLQVRPGSTVDGVFYVGGTSGAGNVSYTGTLVIESMDITNDVAGIVTASFSGQGTGELVEAALS